jgi:hypothetical protein
MQLNRRTFWWSLALLLFVVATLAKHAYNELCRGLYRAYNQPNARSVGSAKQQGILVADFGIEPMKLVGEGKTYEFGEAWLEAAYEPRTLLVWLSYDKRASWSYLCVRPKSDWFHDTYSFSLTPEYKRDMKIASFTSDQTAFTQSGNDLYFQRVPTDLTELTIKVSVDFYGKREDVILGSVRLTRRE